MTPDGGAQEMTDGMSAATRRAKVVEALEDGDRTFILLRNLLLGALLERADGRIEITDEESCRIEVHNVVVYYDQERHSTVFEIPVSRPYPGGLDQ